MNMFAFLGYMLTCWLAADFLSGFWHWVEDAPSDRSYHLRVIPY